MALYEGFDFSGGVRGSQIKDKPEEQTADLSGGVLGRSAKQQATEEPTGPVMKAYDAPWYEDVLDFATDVKDNLAHGESWSMAHNYFKSVLNPNIAVPIFDEAGNVTGSRHETDAERRDRIKSHNESAAELYGLDPDSAAAWTAKIGSAFLDPTTYTVPIGNTYKAAAVIGGTVTANDMMAYNLAQEGQVDWADAGLAGSFGVFLGPASKLIVDKAIPAYKALRTKNPKITHDDAVMEVVKALPAPEKRLALPAPAPQKLLPSPAKSTAPYYISTKGKPVGSLQPEAPYKRTYIIEDADSAFTKRMQANDMWAARNTPPSEGLTDIVVQAIPNKNRNAMTLAFEKASKRSEKSIDDLTNHFRQGGQVNQQLMYHIASTGLGSVVGGAMGGEEGALYGAAAGISAPFLFRHMIAKPVKALNQWSKSDAAGAFAIGKYMSSPTAALKRFGPAGRKLADMMETFHENVDMRMGEKLFEFEKGFGHLSKKEMNRIRGLLDHTILPKNATAQEKKAATLLRRELNSVLDDAVDAGIMTAKQAAKFKDKARNVGYFPRLYDVEYMSSKKGKEAWVKAWTEWAERDESRMLNALNSIVGDKDAVKKMLDRSGGKMTRENALSLLKIMRNNNHHGRSAHLEHTRKIDENVEELLRPFLIEDPWAILARYYDDVYRRIEGSKMFGGQMAPRTKKGTPFWNPDAKAEKMFQDILESGDDDAYNLARDTYFTVMGDSKSSIVEKYQRLSEMEGRILRGAGGFETGAKLSMAQMANSFQATVNGMTRLLHVTGNPIQSMNLFARGLTKSLGKEGGEFAQRVGASIETTLMEAAGEGSNLGKFGERTLRYTGFIAAEKFQRRLAANLGKQYADSLSTQYAKIQAGTLKGGKANKVLRQMKELGLPTDRPITPVDIDRAGLRFSNDVNFRNTPDKLPLAWQGPYGKLFTKFKSFSFHQAKFVKNNVIKPALRGNVMPLLWYTAPAATLGMGIDELRRMVKGDDRELSLTERYLRGITMIGGLGILQDTISAFHRSPEAGIANAAGPFVGDVARLGYGTAQAVAGEPEKLLEESLRTFVFPGREAIIDELSSEGKKRGSRGSRSSSNRGGSRGTGR